MQRFTTKMDAMLLGFSSGIAGLFSHDWFLQFISAITIILGCIAAAFGVKGQSHDSKKKETEVEIAKADLELKQLAILEKKQQLKLENGITQD
jgi:hypothetical protein